MHPIRAIMQRLKLRRGSQDQALDQKVAEFINEVDTHVRVFELDPNLPEILKIKRNARQMLSRSMGDGDARLAIMFLNPYKDVSYTSSHLTVHERMFGHVLQAWSLVEFHLPAYEIEKIQRIRVDKSGTSVYAYQWDREVAHYSAGVLNPHRAGDPGNRVQNAAAFVDHFTGLNLLDNWRELHKYHWIEVTKQEDGSWSVEYDTEPAYA